MRGPIWRAGAWWYREPDGSWRRWIEATRTWEPIPWRPPGAGWPFRLGRNPPPPPPQRWSDVSEPRPNQAVGSGLSRWTKTLRLIVVVAVTLVPLIVPAAAGWVRKALGSTDPCEQSESILEKGNVVRLTPTGRALAQSLILAPGPDWVLNANYSEDVSLVSYGHGNAQDALAWQRALAENRFRQGWNRVWLLGAPTAHPDTLIEEVLEFDTPGGASRFQWWVTQHICEAALEAFEVPDLPGAVGVRFYRAVDASTADQVSFVAGNRRYTVLLGAVRGLPDREQLFDLVHQAIQLATAPGDACGDAEALIADAMTEANTGQSGQIDHLARLVPVQPPHGFRLMHATGGSVELGPGPNPPQFDRTWTDGVTVLSEEIIQFPDVGSARRSFEDSARSFCPRASTVSIMREIPGSLVFFVQEEETLNQLVFFVRGSRVYTIDYGGPPSESPGDTLITFALRAGTVAR
jgi:hypothetical protein